MSDNFVDKHGNIYDEGTGERISPGPLRITIHPPSDEDDIPDDPFAINDRGIDVEEVQEQEDDIPDDPFARSESPAELYQESQIEAENNYVPPSPKEPVAPEGYGVRTIGDFTPEDLAYLSLTRRVPLSDSEEPESVKEFNAFTEERLKEWDALKVEYDASTNPTEKAKLEDQLYNINTDMQNTWERFSQSPYNPRIRYLVPNGDITQFGTDRKWTRVSDDDATITVMKLVDREDHLIEDDTMFNYTSAWWHGERYNFREGVQPLIDEVFPTHGLGGTVNRLLFRPIAESAVELGELAFEAVDATVYLAQDAAEETVLALGGKPSEAKWYADKVRDWAHVLLEFSETTPAAAWTLKPVLRPLLFTQKVADQKALKRWIRAEDRAIAQENKVLDYNKILLETGTVRRRNAEEAARVAEENGDLALDIVRDMQVSLGVSNLIKRSRIKIGATEDGKPIFKQDADGAYIYNERVDYDAVSEEGQRQLERLRVLADEDAAASGGKTVRMGGEERASLATDDVISGIEETRQDILRTALNVDTLKKYVAIAADLRKTHPIPKNKKVTEWLFETMANAENLDDPLLNGLLTSVNKYGVDFQSFAAMVYSNYSYAARTLQTASGLRRVPTKGDKEYAALKAMYAEEGAFLKGVRRLENIRRGAMVSAFKTASRNFQSGLVRGGFEGLRNIWESAIKEVGMRNWRQAGRELAPLNFGRDYGRLSLRKFGINKDVHTRFKLSEEWSRSFGQVRFLIDRLRDPTDVQGITQLMLGQSQFKTLHEKFYRNYNEIQQVIDVPPPTTAAGKAANFLLDEGEDLVWTLNAPNRWQEFVLRESHFMSEIIRLTRQEWKTDLVEGLMKGKLDDFINDAASLRGDSKFRFYDLMEQASTKALRATYAAEPETAIGQWLNTGITRFGLTLAIPFPRFMITSMELIGNMVAGAPIAGMRMALGPRKFMGATGLGDRAIANQIATNISGLGTLAVAWQFRNSVFAGAKYDEAVVGDDKINLGPLYYLPQMLMIAEATKALVEGRPFPITKRDAVQTLTGSGFRPGQTIDSVTKTLLDALGDDGLDWDKAGALALGTFVGEVGASFLQPLTMAVDLGRVIQEDPDLVYKDTKPDPNYGAWDAFKGGFNRPFNVKGFGLYDQEQLKATIKALANDAQYQKYKDPKRYAEIISEIETLQERRVSDRISASREEAAKRGSPLLNFLGVGTSEKDTPEQFFLKELRLDDYVIGGKTGVASIDREVDEYLNDYVPELVREIMSMPNMNLSR